MKALSEIVNQLQVLGISSARIIELQNLEDAATLEEKSELAELLTQNNNDVSSAKNEMIDYIEQNVNWKYYNEKGTLHFVPITAVSTDDYKSTTYNGRIEQNVVYLKDVYGYGDFDVIRIGQESFCFVGGWELSLKEALSKLSSLSLFVMFRNYFAKEVVPSSNFFDPIFLYDYGRTNSIITKGKKTGIRILHSRYSSFETINPVNIWE